MSILQDLRFDFKKFRILEIFNFIMNTKTAFNQGLHCLLTGAEIHHFIDIFTHSPCKIQMDYSIVIVSICMG